MATDLDGWYFEREGQKVGPLTLGELKQRVTRRELDRLTKVWATGMGDWVEARTLPMLFPSGASLGMQMLLPVGRSAHAIAAGYLGLLSFIPFVGYLAIVFSVLAILDLRKHREKSGWGRVVVGLLMGGIFSAMYTFMYLR